MKKFFTILAAGGLLIRAAAQGPEVTSWMINTTGLTGYNGIEADVQQVQYSTNSVYVSCSGIPDYTIGPWQSNPNTPSDQNWVFKIPRNPVQNTGTPTATGLGNIGVFINGMTLFNAKDAFSYNNQNIWHQNAVVVEAISFDACLGHPAPGGSYHNHQNPTCLYVANSSQHSGILGYAFDGYPVYGPYAYANTNGTGGIVRMESSYQLRNITVRQTLPDGTPLTAGQYGPAVSGTYPLGYYIEDFEYVSGLGDLDEHNGRFCVTPEYPSGIYAYFITIDSTGASAYPYAIGPTYYGIVETANIGPGGGHVTISETVTNYVPQTGIAQQASGNTAIKIYPNPADDIITIDFGGTQQSPSTISIQNSLGQLVLKQEAGADLSSAQLSLGHLPAGLYLVEVVTATSRTVNRVSVH
ncbi:MAG: hypothetical protein FD123_1306 [Bacteroidetes bacterium]|nr:MAG: hypothetical protein FD123_1306 [Bacteroidota bacterium]